MSINYKLKCHDLRVLYNMKSLCMSERGKVLGIKKNVITTSGRGTPTNHYLTRYHSSHTYINFIYRHNIENIYFQKAVYSSYYNAKVYCTMCI